MSFTKRAPVVGQIVMSQEEKDFRTLIEAALSASPSAPEVVVTLGKTWLDFSRGAKDRIYADLQKQGWTPRVTYGTYEESYHAVMTLT